MAEISTRAVRALTDTHTDIHTYRQTDYCNPAAHAQRVNKKKTATGQRVAPVEQRWRRAGEMGQSLIV